MFRKIIENVKWKLKYNRLLIDYESLSSNTVKKLEKELALLTKNMEYRNRIDELEKKKHELSVELMRYKKKYGKLEGGENNDENKS